jgi:hypothetical protein
MAAKATTKMTAPKRIIARRLANPDQACAVVSFHQEARTSGALAVDTAVGAAAGTGAADAELGVHVRKAKRTIDASRRCSCFVMMPTQRAIVYASTRAAGSW